MAITDIAAFAHLTDADVEDLAVEFDQIRTEVLDSLGERDAAYIHRTIVAQRALEVAGRLLLAASSRRGPRWAGTAVLALAKIVENMEIGHNVMHGQWDWMNDPEIHSTSWEWDMNAASKHWRYTHNYMHHKYTNILDLDDDVGYGVLRVTRDQPWQPRHLFNLAFNALLAFGFEFGIGLQHVEAGRYALGGAEREATVVRVREFTGKVARQLAKDYLVFPALTAVSPAATFTGTVKANAIANVIRNVWANAVIFCGHFPDGAEKFHPEDLLDESRGQWYLRQLLGSANINAGPTLRFLTGSLSHQIEHHLYPDLPSNRYGQIALRVRAVCDRYDLPYTTGPLAVQYAKTWRTLAKLSLPDRYLRADADNAPETRSEKMFGARRALGVDPRTGRRRGLKTALAAVRRRRGAAAH